LADVVEFEFPSNLDIVIAFASLIHVKKPELQDILDKIYTVLNENGLTYLSLKYSSSYKKITKEDDLGERTYYLYSKEDIYKLKRNFKILEYNIHKVRDQEWLDVILQKITTSDKF